jgi:hypothetical protein
VNNLVFNNVASLLKTTLYAQNSNNEIAILKMDASDNLLVAIGAPVTVSGSVTVAGTVTVSEITSPVTVTGTVAVSEITSPVTVTGSVTVAGTVTVSEITSPVTVEGTVVVSEITSPVTVSGSVTVAGTVTVSEITSPVTVEGTVTVSEITSPVTIGNASLTVTIAGSDFTSLTVSNQAITSTGVLFDNTDISALKVASIFLYNGGATPITLSLQISPVDSNSFYVDDPSYTDQVVPGNGNMYIAVSNFAHYARLQYNMGANTGTISAYLNAQA